MIGNSEYWEAANNRRFRKFKKPYFSEETAKKLSISFITKHPLTLLKMKVGWDSNIVHNLKIYTVCNKIGVWYNPNWHQT